MKIDLIHRSAFSGTRGIDHNVKKTYQSIIKCIDLITKHALRPLGLSQKSKPRDGTEFKIISSQYLKNRNIACHKPLHTYQPYTIGSNHNKHQTKNYLVSMVTRLDFSATGRNECNIVFCNLGSEPNSISVNS